MTRIKPPMVAGIFYPAAAEELKADVDRMLAAAATASTARPQALVAPHAGFRYSGEIAASAYATLPPWKEVIRRVVVLSPSHRVAVSGIATSSADAFRTPLGDVVVDREGVERVERIAGVEVFDAAFAEEHALEVQLPWLQRTLGDFGLVPLIVGHTDAELTEAVIEALKRPDTLFVVSSDLSHYETYAACARHDRSTTTLIETLQAGSIGPGDACGAFPLRGLITAARASGWHAQTLDLRNSGDTSGDRSRVVGYGAYAFYQ